MKYFYLLFLTVLSMSGLDVKAQSTHQQMIDCILEFGLKELGKPYMGGTLDDGCAEELVCTNEKYDCVTFVEYVFAQARLNVYGKTSETLQSQLTKLRYKDGVIAGYGSRLHYFRSWILQAEKNGYVKDITYKIGGQKLQKTINFITTNKDKYLKMSGCTGADLKINLVKLTAMEKSLSESTYYEISKYEVAAAMTKIKPGDIIAFATQLAGLDVVHTGFAVNVGGKIHLLHASSQEKKVVVSDLPLDLYLTGNKSQSGIIVVRPK